MSAPESRIEVYYGGQVQGVGFRFTARSVASGFQAAGYVRNLADGRVELVAEGPADDLESLLGGIRERMSTNIQEEDIAWTDPTGDYETFDIRR